MPKLKPQKTEAVPEKIREANLFDMVRPYFWRIVGLALLTIAGNALNLTMPKIVAGAIDTYTGGHLAVNQIVFEFVLAAVFILVFTYLQSIAQVYTAEKVAKDLRKKLAAKISVQSTGYIQQAVPAKLLTNLTSDVDAVKNFVSQAISSIISSIFLIIGASTLLLLIDWRLALAVIAITPFIGVTFFMVLRKVHKLFRRSQEAIDWLNKVINESILGATLIRLLNSNQFEYEKFLEANTEAKTIGFSILRLFASLIPVITFFTNLATLIILSLGGHFVITGAMTLGNFTAFNNYLAILIFPILVISFMSNVIAQADASYQRLKVVLDSEPKPDTGTLLDDLRGEVSVKNVTVILGDRAVLDQISFDVKAGSKTAIIGPTAAGKTQLLYLLTGLSEPTSGLVEYDGKSIDDYNKEKLHQQVALVFQDSIIFNLSLRENIAFSNIVADDSLTKAIATAELGDFIEALPDKLDTIVSERGASLSGGQKQRIMLARALALNPRVLLLDDFTARVDTRTERKILKNVEKNYPDLTLISVTQKIAPIEHYDHIILLMEGQVLAQGTHQELMQKSPEYVQIYNSQKSTDNYELHAE
jgi:ATP-binding cassette subfamily B protein